MGQFPIVLLISEVYRFMKDLEDLDREIIDRLYKGGDLLGISLVDSIIIGNGSYHSMREEGEL